MLRSSEKKCPYEVFNKKCIKKSNRKDKMQFSTNWYHAFKKEKYDLNHIYRESC